MTGQTNMPEQKLPVFMIVDGELVRKLDDLRDPNRRYAQVVDPDGSYFREFTDEEERQRDEEEARWKADAPQRELEAKRQAEEADAFKSSLRYETRLVAFIDILGWTEAVKAMPSNVEQVQKLGLVLNTIRAQAQQCEWMKENGGDCGWPGDLQITQFSDCLTISTQCDNAGKSQLISTLGVLSLNLLHQGFLLRGGITVGELYHQESMLFGPAFLKAYELESRQAIYPRIILDPILSKQWGQGDAYIQKDGSLIDYARTWRLSHDGFHFFDFLQPFGGAPSFRDSPKLIKHSLDPLRSLLVERLNMYKDNLSVFPKYVWLTNYFNDVCIEFEDCGVEPIEL